MDMLHIHDSIMLMQYPGSAHKDCSFVCMIKILDSLFLQYLAHRAQ